jgi:hypothetical protein
MFRKLFPFLALLVFTLSACEFQEPVQSIPRLAAQGGAGYRTFDLIHSRIIGQDAYTVSIQTGPFIIENCMCKVVSYQLTVSPSTYLQWRLALVQQNEPVGFAPSTYEIEDILTINDIELIFRNIGNPGNGKLQANFVRISSEQEIELTHAGGLCIIENYDGNGTGGNPIGSSATGPIVQLKPGSLPDSYIVKVYIPVGITRPM